MSEASISIAQAGIGAFSCQEIPAPPNIYSMRTTLQSVLELVIWRVLMSRISQRSCCCEMNMFRPCPAQECPSSVDELRK
jgi:hypothetical protein